MESMHIAMLAVASACLCLNSAAVEFPGSKDDKRVVSVFSEGKLIAEVKVVAPATIDVTGTTDIKVMALPGGNHMMDVKDGSVEIQPEKGKPVKISAEVIKIYGYKSETKK